METLDTQRRTLIKGAAWSIPVIAAAIATPLAAASPNTSEPAKARLVWNTWRNNWAWGNAGNVTGLRTGVQIENRYHADDAYTIVSEDVQLVDVVITYPAGVITDTSVGAAQLSGSDWSIVKSEQHTDGTVSYTVRFVGLIAASRNTGELNLVVPASRPNGASVSVTAYTFAPNADAVTAPTYGNTVY